MSAPVPSSAERHSPSDPKPTVLVALSLLRLLLLTAGVLLFTKLLNAFPGPKAEDYNLFALQTYCFTAALFLAASTLFNSLRTGYLFTVIAYALFFTVNLGVFEAYGRGLFASDIAFTLSNLENLGFLSSYSQQLLFATPSDALLRLAGLTALFIGLALVDRLATPHLARRFETAAPLRVRLPAMPLRWRLPAALLLVVFALPLWFIWVKHHFVDWLMIDDIESGWHNAGPLVGFAATVHWKVDVASRDGDADARAAALLEGAQPGAAAAMTTPDIVIWLNESTFDPQELSALYPRLRDPAVLRHFDRVTCCRQDARDWRGTLGVNTVVGGTWVSEFEILTGMRTSWFGPSAYYSHYVLGPIVDRTLFKALTDEGYDSSVIYPVSGDFFFARQAYGFYGADRFLDPEDLGLSGPDMLRLDDNSFLPPLFDILQSTQVPQFVVVLTNYNHGPHGASHPAGAEANPAQAKIDELAAELAKDLAVPADIADYLARLTHTNETLTTLEAQVKAAEKATILIHFGDHKPLLGALDQLARFNSYASIVSNRPLDAVPWLAEVEKIDIIFVPGILCRLSGCQDPLLQLNYEVAALCKGDARDCKEEKFQAYKAVARSNFRP